MTDSIAAIDSVHPRWSSPHRLSFVGLILLIVMGGFFSASGAQLRMKNGDVLTGDFIARKNGRIVFLTSHFGELSIAEHEAVVVDTPDTPIEALVGIPTIPARPAPSVSRPTATPTQLRRNAWKGQLEFGFQQQNGRNNSEQVSLRGEAEKKVEKNVYRWEGKALYNRQNARTTADRYETIFRYRHDLSGKMFAQSRTSYSKDRVKLIDDNIEENLGLGYKVIAGARHAANIGSGLTAQYRSAQGFEDSTSYLVEFFQDYTYKLTGRITVAQDANVAYAPETQQRLATLSSPSTESAANYRIRYNTALRGKVSERVSLNLRFEYEFDNAISDPAAKVSQRVTSSIGYGF